MKPIPLALWLATVVAALLVGRYLLPDQRGSHGVEIESFRAALSDSDWIRRGHTISAYLEQLNAEQLPAAVAVVEDRRRWMTQDELRLFMIAWARLDAPGALAATLAWPDHTRRKGAAAAVYAWAIEDPLGARDALETVNDASLRELLIDRLVAAWVHGSDREGVTAYVALLSDSSKRSRFTSVLAHEIFADGPTALMEWADSIPASDNADYKATAFGRAAGVLAQDDPERAARWVEAHSGESWAREAPSIVGRRWAEREPLPALAWVRSLPPASGRDRAMVTAFRVWLGESPVSAEAWLVKEPSERALDPARAMWIRRRAAIDPPSTLAMLDLIADVNIRQESMFQIGWNWRRIDSQAADRWLEQVELSQEAREAVLHEQRVPHRQAPRPVGRRARSLSDDDPPAPDLAITEKLAP
ncbi:MAG: hypothetical protein JRH17_13065 [Deltaproteobacteria bacterium]|nr:hypothetical protein [Deltaproteobacteria bacterium]